jgi:hypothetical protein
VFAIIGPLFDPRVSGINNAGQIIGSSTAGNNFVGFIYAGGAFTTLNAPNTGGEGGATDLTGINNAGQIVGNGQAGGATLRASADSSTVLGHSPP